ncbi:MAG: hypothetical protein NVS2B12_40350 [Ktedonobacteraceae bacterium]
MLSWQFYQGLLRSYAAWAYSAPLSMWFHEMGYSSILIFSLLKQNTVCVQLPQREEIMGIERVPL